jgi:NADPH2:quinone reductase
MEYPRIIPHSDGAGIIDDVGDGVQTELIGRRVWLYNGQRNGRAFGTAAQFISLSADLVTPLPGHVTFAEGATLGIPCMTAHRCVFVAASVADKTILVTGGAGAVGHYAIQLAKWGGARVIATVSSDLKAERALSAGADHVIDYRHEDVAKAVRVLTHAQGVDHVVDVDFGGNLYAVLASVRINGSVAYYASGREGLPRLPARDVMRKNLSIHGVYLPMSPVDVRHQAQSDITRWLDTGRAKLSVAATFALVDTSNAHDFVEAGGKLGTVVVLPDNVSP